MWMDGCMGGWKYTGMEGCTFGMHCLHIVYVQDNTQPTTDYEEKSQKQERRNDSAKRSLGLRAAARAALRRPEEGLHLSAPA